MRTPQTNGVSAEPKGTKRPALSVTKASDTKRSRVADGTSRPSAPKPKAKAKPKPKAKTPVSKTKTKAALPDSDSDSSASSSSSGDDDDSVEADSSNDEKPPRKECPVAESAVGSALPPSDPIQDVLGDENKMLSDTAMDALLGLILNMPSALKEKIVVFSSVQLQAVLSAHCNQRDDLTRENVHTKLGTTREIVDAAELVVSIVHGPTTEYQASGIRAYANRDVVNYHWSMVVYARASNQAFHYDSKYPLNDERSVEVLRVLHDLGVIPDDADSVSSPVFFPVQEDNWECGFFVLVTILIMSQKLNPEPLTRGDVEQYAPFFSTIGDGAAALFKQRLSEIVVSSRYTKR